MNILPLVFTFLIIFACIAFTFFREVKSYYLAETALRGYNRTERVVNNAIVQNTYRKIPTEKTEKKEPRAPKSTLYHSKRTLSPPLEKSKFNLAPLIKFEGDIRLHPLYEPLAEFLRLLYGKRVFDKEPHSEKIEYRLIEAMVKEGKKDPFASTDLFQFYPQDPALKPAFYKMLQGTNQYSRDKGIPPLRDFLSLQKDTPTVSLSFASPLLLEALFSREVADLILEEEQKKWTETDKYYFYSKNDLQAALTKYPSLALTLAPIEPHLDYSKQLTQKLLIGGRDKQTGIGLEKQL